MNGRITLNEKVKIESELVNGLYKVIEINYSGDNWNGSFVAEGVGVEIEQS